MGKVWQIVKETFSDFIEDNALSRGAAIAFYTVLSLGPVLVICVAIAGLVFGHDAAQGAMVGQLQGMMGEDSAKAVQNMVASAGQHKSGVWATVIGGITLLITASGVFGEMQSALNFIWKAQPKGGLTTILRARALSLGLVATLGFLLLVSLVVSAGLSALGDYLNAIMPGIKLILQIASLVVSFAMVSALFAAIYKILPDRQLDWEDTIVGAVATAVLFTIGKSLIAWYIGGFGVASSYGAAGALIVVLLWIYYSSVIFLLGSEFTKVWAAHHGSAEAFAARTATPAQMAAAPSPVQKVIAHGAQHRAGIGLFDVAALGTLLFMAVKGRGRTDWF